MLQYSNGSSTWRATVRAANLVSGIGASGLPAPRGTIEFIDYPGPVGRHPVQQLYPGLEIYHKLMVFRDAHFVERGRTRGVALYFDWNGSGLSASVTSINGRSLVAPWDWEGSEVGSPTDCSTAPWMEWRSVPTANYGRTTWMNHNIHGWPGWNSEYRGLDWQDGVPTDLRTMYNKANGTVRQYIMVPNFADGLGLAEQTLPASVVTKTMTTLVWFPKDAVKNGVARMSSGGTAYRSGGGMAYGLPMESMGVSKGVTRGGGGSEPEPDLKMAVGDEIRQGIIPNPFGPDCWPQAPSVAFVCWPVSEQKARELMQGTMPSGRVTF